MRRSVCRLSRSEAFAEAATTLARREKEKIKESILKNKGKQSPFATGKYSAAVGAPTTAAEEQPMRVNRKTGLPLYEAQAVKSSAHVFKEYKKQHGVPMPPATPSLDAPSAQPYFLPTFLALGISACLLYYTSQSPVALTDSTASWEGLAATGLGAGESPNSVAPPAAEYEGEGLTVAHPQSQQPLWLQRQR